MRSRFRLRGAMTFGIGVLLAVLGMAYSPAQAHEHAHGAAPADVLRSARSGDWSEPATWEGGKVPAAGARVLIREGHTVRYDVASDDVIRAINIAGTLRFATDRDTRLTV